MGTELGTASLIYTIEPRTRRSERQNLKLQNPEKKKSIVVCYERMEMCGV